MFTVIKEIIASGIIIVTNFALVISTTTMDDIEAYLEAQVDVSLNVFYLVILLLMSMFVMLGESVSST